MHENLCSACIHNRSTASLDCEYACSGVTRIEDDGLIVAACDDFAEKGTEQCIE